MTIVSGTYCLPMGGKGTSSNLKIEVVSALPATGRVDRIYFVPIEGATGDNQYTEYVWDKDRQRFEEVGPRKIDLTPYATKEALSAVDNRLKSAEEEIVAVQGDVAALDADVSTVVPIVADHTASITAINDSIEMLNTDVADVRATKQDVLTAGDNITIVDNVISATGGGGGGEYTLPTASTTTLGGIKVGANLSITEDGVLSATGGGSGGGSGTALTSADGATTYSELALGETLAVIDTSTKELNGLTQTGGTLNSELEFTGASGASLKMTEKYSLSTADSWEFQIKYKHNGGGNSPTIFGYASGSDFKTPAFIHESGSLKLYLSSSGGSWDLNQANSGLVPVVGTTYYFKVGFTGSQYYIKYNTTGWSDEFTTQWTLNSTTKVYCSDYFMLMNLSLNSGYYNTGTMYLQDTVLIINGAEVWRGAKIIPGDIILNTNIENAVQSATIHSMVVMTQAEYDALTTKDPTALYLIREETT